MRKQCWSTVLLTAAAVAAATPAWSADWYVATTGNDTTGDGSSGNPFATINKAVNAASPGDSIYVAPGTYTFSTSPRVTVNKPLSLYGAQAGVDARSRSGPETVIDVGSSASVPGIHISTGNVTIDGFKIQGTGNNQSFITGAVPGSGITTPYTGLVIRNCWLSGVQDATNNGIHLEGCSALVERNLIGNCKNGLNGGTDRGTPSQDDDVRIDVIIRENEFVGCRWTLGGYTASGTITKNLFRDSVYPAGYSNNAIQGEYANTVVEDNVIFNYKSGDGNAVGIFLHNSRADRRPNQSNVVYRNNTIIGCDIGVAVSPNQALASQNVSFQFNSLIGNTVGALNGQGEAEANPLDMSNCWWGSADGPSGEGPGTGNSASTGITYDPWVGKDSSGSALELADDSPADISVNDGQTSASADVTPDTGTGAGHTYSIAIEPGPATQGYAGFYNGLALPGSLHVVTTLPDGSYKATLKLYYNEADLAAAGIYREDGLVLKVWDEVTDQWVLAVEKNIDPARTDKGVSAPTDTLGDYGVDTTNNFVWAVVDHASDYAAGAKDASALPVALSAFGID